MSPNLEIGQRIFLGANADYLLYMKPEDNDFVMFSLAEYGAEFEYIGRAKTTEAIGALLGGGGVWLLGGPQRLVSANVGVDALGEIAVWFPDSGGTGEIVYLGPINKPLVLMLAEDRSVDVPGIASG